MRLMKVITVFPIWIMIKSFDLLFDHLQTDIKKEKKRKKRFRLTLEPIVEEGPLTRQRAREITFINPPKPKIIMASKLEELEEKKNKEREERKKKRKAKEKFNTVTTTENNNGSAREIENQTTNKGTVTDNLMDKELVPSVKKKRIEEDEININSIQSSESNSSLK
jgi:hypothetical protein